MNTLNYTLTTLWSQRVDWWKDRVQTIIGVCQQMSSHRAPSGARSEAGELRLGRSIREAG